jgi:hypothetical protein
MTGVLLAQAATVAGAAELEHPLTGVLTAQPSTVAGAAELEHPMTGVLAAGAASVAGALYFDLSMTGALVSQTASVSGVMAFDRMLNGALVSGPASVTGAAFLGLRMTGDLDAGAASVAGDMKIARDITGVLVAGSASVSGLVVIPPKLLTMTGELDADPAMLLGVATTGGPIVVTVEAFYLLGGWYSFRVLHPDPGLVILLQQQIPGDDWIDVSIPVIGDYDTTVALPPGTYRFAANVVGTPAITLVRVFRRGPL